MLFVCFTSKNDLSSVFFGGPGIGAAGVTDTTSAKSVILIHLYKLNKT